jgi:hypothetical protein
MNAFFKSLTLIFNFGLLLACFASCNHKDHHNHENKLMKTPAMAHNVYFWLKENTTDEQRMEFEKGLQKLGTVPSIHSYYWGVPAPTEDRDVIDNSYHYSINALFLSLEDQRLYQEDPIHLDFIENHNEIWESVKVYDNMTN